MSVVSQRPRRQYEVLNWGHVDLQEYANGRFVSNNNIFTIVFFNTYYHKQINKILISACNETFRQSSDPVYAHTPMRNVGGLRTFNPKLKDSAGGEVNQQFQRWPPDIGSIADGPYWPSHSWDKAISNVDPEYLRSRSGLWSKGKVRQSAQYPTDLVLFLFYFTSISSLFHIPYGFAY